MGWARWSYAWLMAAAVGKAVPRGGHRHALSNRKVTLQPNEASVVAIAQWLGGVCVARADCVAACGERGEGPGNGEQKEIGLWHVYPACRPGLRKMKPEAVWGRKEERVRIAEASRVDWIWLKSYIGSTFRFNRARLCGVNSWAVKILRFRCDRWSG